MFSFENLSPASRAFLPGADSDGALGSAEADVVLFVLNSSLEESLAGLAGEDAVMEAGYLVSAHGARRVDQLLPGDARLARGEGRHLLRVMRRMRRGGEGRGGVMPGEDHRV